MFWGYHHFCWKHPTVGCSCCSLMVDIQDPICHEFRIFGVFLQNCLPSRETSMKKVIVTREVTIREILVKVSLKWKQGAASGGHEDRGSCTPRISWKPGAKHVQTTITATSSTRALFCPLPVVVVVSLAHPAVKLQGTYAFSWKPRVNNKHSGALATPRLIAKHDPNFYCALKLQKN